MAPPWCVQCTSCDRSRYAFGENALWTGQVVTHATLSSRRGSSLRLGPAHNQEAAICAKCARCTAHSLSSAASNVAGTGKLQHLLWRTLLLDHTRWWDNRYQTRNPRPPRSLYTVCRQAVRLDNCYKPAWMDAQLATLDARAEHSASAPSLLSDHADQLLRPGPGKLLTPEFVKKLCEQGQVKAAVEVLQVLVETNIGLDIDKYLFYFVLKTCVAKKDMMLAGQIHALAVKKGFSSDTFLCNHFIRMYAGHGKLREAMDVFTGVALPDAFMWSSIITAHVMQGQAHRAIDLYQHMRATRTRPDDYVFVAALQACAAAGDLQAGKQMHDDVLTSGMKHHMFISNCLIEMYIKCGSFKDARRVFDGLKKKNVVTWTLLIAGYAKVESMCEEALCLHSAMVNAGTAVPDRVTFVCLLQACANVGVSALDKGKQLHSQIREQRLDFDVAVGGSLVNMYAKCGSVTDARTVFDGLREKNVMTWNAMISGYAKVEGMGQEALNMYSAMQNKGMATPNAVTFVCVLQACANVGESALKEGKQLHSLLQERRLDSDIVMGGSLVNMYAKCGSLNDAQVVFDSLREKNVVTWSAMIAGYAKVEGMGQEALNLYSAMRVEGMATPNEVTFVCLLHACANVGASAIEKGRQLHSELRERGLESDVVVGGSLVNMYAKCGSLTDAKTVFDGLREKNVVTWNALLAGYAKVAGMGQNALNMYIAMHYEHMVTPNAVTFVCLLQACANVGLPALKFGKQLHFQLRERELESDVVVGGSLVNMYVKCGSLTDARMVFDGLGEKDVVAWNAMIAGYAKEEGTGEDALSLYSDMHNEGHIIPDAVTFVCLLQACANVGLPALEMGKQLHSQLRERGLEADVIISGSVVNMYAKCGSLKEARMVFDRIVEKNVITWTAMIGGYSKVEGMGQEALFLYGEMHNEGLAIPDAVTFVCLLQACANVGVSALEKGKQLHSQLKLQRFESDMVVGGSLVNMYGKCGCLKDARNVFDRLTEKDVVAWNAMISGYAQQGMGQEALRLYSSMRNEGMTIPDRVTFICLLQACGDVGVSALVDGKHLHSELKRRGLESDCVVGGSLVNMYAKCGSLLDARIVFEQLCEKDLATWNAIISGYAQQEGVAQEALKIYGAMQTDVMADPDQVTYVSLLQACASVGALQQGKVLHSKIRQGGLECDIFIGTSLVKMYAECGRLELSREVFQSLPVKSLETWTALLQGYAEHAEGGMAIQCFEELLEQGMKPDEVTYICLLTACSHAGLVNEGQQYFETMEERDGVKPDDRHYTCMVDLLGRAGHLDRAEKMLRASGLADSIVSWTALLTACKSYGDADLGRRCFDHLVNLQPEVATAYTLLGSLFANAGRWDEVEKVETLRKAAGARKKAAKACIEVKEEVHEFTVGEERSDISATLRKINSMAKQNGHVPQTQLVLRTVSEQEKEDSLCGHAEKLALAYGLLNTLAGSPLVVTKNLRMCNDCHSSTKIMSRLEKREIVVRDGHKVHRFENGVCSCQDRP